MSEERMTSLSKTGAGFIGVISTVFLDYNAIFDEFSKCPSVDV